VVTQRCTRLQWLCCRCVLLFAICLELEYSEGFGDCSDSEDVYEIH